MGLEKMRLNATHGKCPFFFVALLVLALFFLTCNWWSLTTDNMELLKEMQKLDTQLNQCTKQLTTCNYNKDSLETRVQQEEESILRSNNNEKAALSELKTVRKQREDTLALTNRTQNSLTMCQTELDSLKNLDQSKTVSLNSLRIEKETLASQLAEKKSKILELEAKISMLQEQQVKQVGAEPKFEITSARAVSKAPLASANEAFNDQLVPNDPAQIENAANEDLGDLADRNII